jgi:hypothetical protein
MDFQLKDVTFSAGYLVTLQHQSMIPIVLKNFELDTVWGNLMNLEKKVIILLNS